MKIAEVTISKTSNKGNGVFANRNFRKGEIVVCGKRIKRVEKRTLHSFQVEENTHVQLDSIARSINHSCEPNTGIQNNSLGGYSFIALKDIQNGEEITWDYETTEYISISITQCFCGSKFCRKVLRGFKYLPILTIIKYNGFIADYLKKDAAYQYFSKGYMQKTIVSRYI